MSRLHDEVRVIRRHQLVVAPRDVGDLHKETLHVRVHPVHDCGISAAKAAHVLVLQSLAALVQELQHILALGVSASSLCIASIVVLCSSAGYTKGVENAARHAQRMTHLPELTKLHLELDVLVALHPAVLLLAHTLNLTLESRQCGFAWSCSWPRSHGSSSCTH